MTPRPASLTYSSPCKSVKRMKRSTVGAGGQSTLRHIPRLQASPHTELTTQIHTSRGRIIVIKTRHTTAGRTTMVPALPSTLHKWSRPWKLKLKRTTSRRTLINDNAPQDRDDVELTFHTEVYAAAIRMADDTEWRDNRCYNCREKGHFWRQCTKPLKEEFQRLLNRPKQRENELNKKGGPRAKGGRVPQPVPAAAPAPTPAAMAPQ